MPFSPSTFGPTGIVLNDDGPALSFSGPEQILQEIRRSFPLRAPRPDDTIEKLMWAGGQQEVVEWVERYINQLLHPSQ
jgi:hypothetical protein